MMKVAPPVHSTLWVRTVVRRWQRHAGVSVFPGRPPGGATAAASSWAVQRDDADDGSAGDVRDGRRGNAARCSDNDTTGGQRDGPSGRGDGCAGRSPGGRGEVGSSAPRRLYTAPNKQAGYGGPDLRRFLEEVGTEAKEARYWLKHFHADLSPDQPFAIVQVDEDVFENAEMFDKLVSSLSFLQRHDMKCVVIHGLHLPNEAALSAEALKVARARLTDDNMTLVSALEAHGSPARPLFAGSGILHATVDPSARCARVSAVNTDPVKWSMRSGHIAVLQGVGETAGGQLVSLDLGQVTAAVARDLRPQKVMMINTTGGIRDERNEIIANINLPVGLARLTSEPWCTAQTMRQVNYISSLLNTLPQHSSVVITCATTLLTELFTYHGSGTFFKNTEPIHMHTSLDDVDVKRLQKLINISFRKELKDDYFEWLQKKLDKLYVSEEYNAAAIITKEDGMSAPYLDKFAVSLSQQGMGTSDLMWDSLQHDFTKLFWRSQGHNRINPWYFKKCDGSWSDGNWTVFWYGMAKHKDSSRLIDHALSLPDSFTPPECAADRICVDVVR